MDPTIHDPALGLSLIFTDERGALVVAVDVEPGGGVPDHFHPTVEERWTVIDGEVEFRLGRDRARHTAGETVVVAANTRHGFRNAGPGLARLRAEIEPAGRMQAFLEEAAALSRARKVTSQGRPASPGAMLELADFATSYFDTTVLCSPPPALQRLVFPVLARVARRRRGASRGPQPDCRDPE
jgi:quercetin dioxygenase-like cupin family protein